MTKHVVIVGGGIIGLSIAYYCSRKGHRVTLIERGDSNRDGCSFVNAGMVVPSHVVPLASPGMVQLGIRWMWNPESPFYVKPRWSADLISWGWKFHRAATQAHVDQREQPNAGRRAFGHWRRRSAARRRTPSAVSGVAEHAARQPSLGNAASRYAGGSQCQEQRSRAVAQTPCGAMTYRRQFMAL